VIESGRGLFEGNVPEFTSNQSNISVGIAYLWDGELGKLRKRRTSVLLNISSYKQYWKRVGKLTALADLH